MIHSAELSALSPELAEHARYLKDSLLPIETPQVRWSLFALNGMFLAFLQLHKRALNDRILYIDEYENIGIIPCADVLPVELEKQEGRQILGCSLEPYAIPHYNFGNLLTVMKQDETIKNPRYERDLPLV